jgi:hypothetical protein
MTSSVGWRLTTEATSFFAAIIAAGELALNAA